MLYPFHIALMFYVFLNQLIHSLSIIESHTAEVQCRQQANNNDSNRNSELTFAKLHEQIGKPIQENLKNERQIVLQ